VIALALAHLPRDQATVLVEQLLAANEDDEDRQRPLFLAAAALAEGALVAGVSQRQIIENLASSVKTWVKWEKDIPKVQLALNILGRLKGNAYATEQLLSLVRHEAMSADYYLVEVTEALRELGQADDLLALVCDKSVSPTMRVAVAKVLGQLGQADKVTPVLLVLACDRTIGWWVRMKAAEALSQVGQTELSVQAYFDIACDETMDAYERVEAAHALGELGYHDKAIEFLLLIARDNTVPSYTRERAFKALAELGQISELLALARDGSVDIEARKQVVGVLHKLDRSEELLVLFSDELLDSEVRIASAVHLGFLGRFGDLLNVACAKKTAVSLRLEAGVVLSIFGRIKEAAQVWLALARDRSVDIRMRVRAVENIEELTVPDEITRAYLTLACDDEVCSYWRIWAIRNLRDKAPAHSIPEVLTRLQAIAENVSTSIEIRPFIYQALEKLHQRQQAMAKVSSP